MRIRRTATRHGLRTEASARFEKALDPELAMTAALRFAQLVLEHVPGARIAAPIADAYPRPAEPLVVNLPLALIARRLGVRIADYQVRSILAALGFKATDRGTSLDVTVPSWRATKDVDCAEDLVEEVGRIRGYDAIEPVAPVAPMTPHAVLPLRGIERRVASVMSLDRGYAETNSYAFYGARDVERLGIEDVEHLDLANPLSEEHDRMILTSLPGLLRAVRRNVVAEATGRLWETGRLVATAWRGAPRRGARRSGRDVVARRSRRSRRRALPLARGRRAPAPGPPRPRGVHRAPGWGTTRCARACRFRCGSIPADAPSSSATDAS